MPTAPRRERREHHAGRKARASYPDHWNLRSYTPPPPERVLEWIRSYKQTGALEDRDRVVESHLQLVAHFAKRHASAAVPFDDLMAEGAITLVRAVDLFDVSRGVPFTAYAAAVLEDSLRGWSGRARDFWRIPAGSRRRLIERARQTELFFIQHGRPPAPGEQPPEPVANVQKTGPRRPTPVPLGSAQPPAPVTAVQALVDPSSTPDAQAEQSDQVQALKQAIAALPESSASLICKRFGLLGEREHTPSELSRTLGVEPRALGRLLSRALTELRTALTRRSQQAGGA